MGSETEGREGARERAILSLLYNLARGHRGHSHVFYSVVEERDTLNVNYTHKKVFIFGWKVPSHPYEPPCAITRETKRTDS